MYININILRPHAEHKGVFSTNYIAVASLKILSIARRNRTIILQSKNINFTKYSISDLFPPYNGRIQIEL